MPSHPLVEELSPLPDAWNIARLFAGWPHLLFLDSSERHLSLGRYSFISADPLEWFELPRFSGGAADPFIPLQQCLERYATERLPGLPPFQGGLAGLFGYGLGHVIERFPRARYDEFRVPDLAVGLYDWVIAIDHGAGPRLVDRSFGKATETSPRYRGRQSCRRA